MNSFHSTEPEESASIFMNNCLNSLFVMPEPMTSLNEAINYKPVRNHAESAYLFFIEGISTVQIGCLELLSELHDVLQVDSLRCVRLLVFLFLF